MALNFPDYPSVGQKYTTGGETWMWNGKAWTIAPAPSTYAPVSVGPNPPTISLNNGDLWWDSTVGKLYIYYVDQNSSQWVAASQIPDGISEVTSAEVIAGFLDGLPAYADIATAVNNGVATGELFKITGSTTLAGVRAIASYGGGGGAGTKGQKGQKGLDGAGSKGQKGALGGKGDKGAKGDQANVAGANTQLQFNNNGAFGASSNLAYTSGNNTLTSAARINNTNQFLDFTSGDTAQAIQVYGAANKEFDIKVGDDINSLGIAAKFTSPSKLTLPSGELDAQEVNATVLSGARQGVVYKLIVGSGLTFEGQVSTHIGGTVGNDWATSSGTIGVNNTVVQITGDANIAGNKKFLADVKVGTALADNLTLSTTGAITTAGNINFTALSDFVDDAAAAAGGIAVGQLYRNGSVVQVRVA